MTDASTVYASNGSALRRDRAAAGSASDTSIHRFDISTATDAPTTARAARSRATCSTSSRSPSTRGCCAWPPTVEAGGEREPELRHRARDAGGGRLEQVGQVGGLGRGERIYAVRFIGDRGYVVTFRQTDPLYTLDLADPAHPRVRGELKILGYSAYLHPVGEHCCSGSARTRRRRARRSARSSRCSTSPTPPRRGCCTSAALGESTRPRPSTTTTRSCGGRPSGSRSCPVSDARRQRRAGGRVPGRSRRGIGVAGTTVERADVLRTLVVGGRLFTLTGEGLHAYDLDSLAPGPFTRLRVRLTARIAAGARCSRHDIPSQTSPGAGRGLRGARALRRPVDGHRRRIRRRRGRVPVGRRDHLRPSFLCTGTLIAPNYVLTAGHCGSITRRRRRVPRRLARRADRRPHRLQQAGPGRARPGLAGDRLAGLPGHLGPRRHAAQALAQLDQGADARRRRRRGEPVGAGHARGDRRLRHDL